MKDISNEQVKDLLLIALIGFVFFINYSLTSAIAAGVSLLILIFPKIGKPIVFSWLQFAKLLSFIIPQIILTAIFYFIIFPIGKIKNLVSSNQDDKSTNYVDRNEELTKEHLMFPF